jgi:cellobiose PTS system EIIC component
MAVAPGAFQINEPIIFGMPLVLNPVFAIPFIFTPPLLVTIAYIFTAIIPFAGYIYISPPWVTPPIISAFLATGGDISATILATVLFLLSIVIYAPFVILADKMGDQE